MLWLSGILAATLLAQADAPVAARTDTPPAAAAPYMARCAPCHGATGNSDTLQGRALKVAPLVDDRRLARMSPAEIVAAITANPKHHNVLDFESIPSSELEAAARYVIDLARPH